MLTPGFWWQGTNRPEKSKQKSKQMIKVLKFTAKVYEPFTPHPVAAMAGWWAWNLLVHTGFVLYWLLFDRNLDLQSWFIGSVVAAWIIPAVYMILVLGRLCTETLIEYYDPRRRATYERNRN